MEKKKKKKNYDHTTQDFAFYEEHYITIWNLLDSNFHIPISKPRSS